MSAPTYVQSANSGWTSGSAAPAFGAGATAGNLLIACHFGRGASSIAAPSGFTAVAAVSGPTNTGNGYGRMFYKVAAGGETTITQGTDPGDLRCLMIAEYGGWSGTPTLDVHNEGVTDFSTGPTQPSITPTASVAAALISCNYNNPNYSASLPSGYTNRESANGGTTPRTWCKLNDQLVATTSGSYAGSYGGAGGETCWDILHAAFINGAGGGGGSTARASSIITLAKRFWPSASGLWVPDRRILVPRAAR